MYFDQTWPSFRLPMGHGSMASVPIPGSGLAGLAQGENDPTEGGECLQPVHYTERDALRNEIKDWVYHSIGAAAAHQHENHPDIRAVYEDIGRRLDGLEKRPKLLRCSAEARSRARIWIGQLKDLRRRAEKQGTADKAGCRATSWIHVTEPFQFTVHRGPTYTIRAGSTRPDCFGAGAAAPSGGAVQSSAPPGSVVVNGVTYPSSAAAAAAAGGSSSSAPTPPGPGEMTGAAPMPFPIPELPSLEGEIFGVPTKYLVYGGAALLAYKFFFKK